MIPVDVVQRQLEAYNARDLGGFLANYSDTIRIYRPPASERLFTGKVTLAQFYANERFNRPELKADILNRTVLGNKVIDHELIWGVREQPFEVALVYEVVDGLIQTIWQFPTE